MAQLETGWNQVLERDLAADGMKKLKEFLVAEYAKGKQIYPSRNEYFAALNATPWGSVRVVILGQDPYHGPGQAHGLAFSVKPGIPAPPSLVNIYKELQSDLGIKPPPHGYLGDWTTQGVLLLNAVLTVESGRAASHQGKGWEAFTDRIIAELSTKKEGLVFVLWGAYAQRKGAIIDRKKHFVVESPHPSPLSSYRGFFGSKPFSKINDYLISRGEKPIRWNLSEDLSNLDMKN